MTWKTITGRDFKKKIQTGQTLLIWTLWAVSSSSPFPGGSCGLQPGRLSVCTRVFKLCANNNKTAYSRWKWMERWRGRKRLLHCLVCSSIGTAGAACAEELLFILINTRRTLENWDSFIVYCLSPSGVVKIVKTAHAHLEEANWPSTNFAMVCVSVWTLPGRFQGSCLTWRRSFLAQFTFGSISCWNSVEKHSGKKISIKNKAFRY